MSHQSRPPTTLTLFSSSLPGPYLFYHFSLHIYVLFIKASAHHLQPPSMARRSIFRLILLLFFHLACFFISSPRPKHDSSPPTSPPPPKRRKVSPLSSSPPSSSATLQHSKPSLIVSYLRNLFSHHPKTKKAEVVPVPPLPYTSKAVAEIDLKPDITSEPPNSKRGSFRTELYPCTACGEVLTTPSLLDHHQVTNHALSNLLDSGRNIVRIIFHSGWPTAESPTVLRILKIHTAPRILARFEEHREAVRSRAVRRQDQRCIADGNERLRFYSSTVICSLGQDSERAPVVCGAQYCTTCAIVRHGFAGKQAELDGIATHATSWGAHVSMPEELEEEFAFMHVRRAMVVCRVIAGRVARCGGAEEEGKGTFDSVVPMRARGGARSSWAEEEELRVFQPRAVLPCFFIIYTA